MKKFLLSLVLCALSLAFAQEGSIKFKLTLDSTGMPIMAPPKPETPQKLGVSSNRALNLAELTAKDTENFDVYSQRRALVQDSILAMQKEIDNSKKRTIAQMQPLEPKGEYEKQSEFDARQEKRERELGEIMVRNYKPFADRLAELEKAKKKIEDNQAALFCNIEVKTSPNAASVLINKKEIGPSPAEFKLALPGLTAIKVLKENYEPWDTTLTLQPAQKLKLNIALQEKSIFSKEGEIDFPKIIAKDTTIGGYYARMGRVNARISQIDAEIVKIREDFSNKYQATFEPQRQGETPQAFESRKAAWSEEGLKQMNLLWSKYEAYRNKLVRSYKALEDNVIANQSQFITEAIPSAQITLGAYDVEKEIFDVEVQDTANAKSPFYFAGRIGIPRDTAKAMNRSTDGFLVGVSYLNYPFISSDTSYSYLAMKDLSISRRAVPLKVSGGFKSLSKFESIKGYAQWRAHADSLLSGSLKTQNLGLNYVLGNEKAAKEAAAEASSSGSSDGGSGLGWRGWTRILTFTAAAALGAVAIVNLIEADNTATEINNMNSDPRVYQPGHSDWLEERTKKGKTMNDYEFSRNMFGAGAGVFAVAGILTFVF